MSNRTKHLVASIVAIVVITLTLWLAYSVAVVTS